MASAWEQNQNHHLIFNQKPVIQTPSITNYQLNYSEDVFHEQKSMQHLH